jgi:hypothetical protein
MAKSAAGAEDRHAATQEWSGVLTVHRLLDAGNRCGAKAQTCEGANGAASIGWVPLISVAMGLHSPLLLPSAVSR